MNAAFLLAPSVGGADSRRRESGSQLLDKLLHGDPRRPQETSEHPGRHTTARVERYGQDNGRLARIREMDVALLSWSELAIRSGRRLG